MGLSEGLGGWVLAPAMISLEWRLPLTGAHVSGAVAAGIYRKSFLPKVMASAESALHHALPDLLESDASHDWAGFVPGLLLHSSDAKCEGHGYIHVRIQNP